MTIQEHNLIIASVPTLNIASPHHQYFVLHGIPTLKWNPSWNPPYGSTVKRVFQEYCKVMSTYCSTASTRLGGEFCQLPSCVSCVKSILWIGPLRQEKDTILLYVYFPCNNLLSYIAILILEYSVTDENHTHT